MLSVYLLKFAYSSHSTSPISILSSAYSGLKIVYYTIISVLRRICERGLRSTHIAHGLPYTRNGITMTLATLSNAFYKPRLSFHPLKMSGARSSWHKLPIVQVVAISTA